MPPELPGSASVRGTAYQHPRGGEQFSRRRAAPQINRAKSEAAGPRAAPCWTVPLIEYGRRGTVRRRGEKISPPADACGRIDVLDTGWPHPTPPPPPIAARHRWHNLDAESAAKRQAI